MNLSSSLLKLAGALAAVALTAPLPALAEGLPATQGVAAAGSAGTIRVDLSTGATSQSLALPMGKSAIVELPVEAREVLVTDPAVADVVLRTPRRISVLGMKSGTTDAVFFDASGRRILSLSVHVDIDAGAVSDMINRVLPGTHVHAEGLNGSIVLSGEVASLSDADKAVQLARAAVPGHPELVLNMMSIAGRDQVMLKVRIVEMQRDVIKQLGFNLQALMGQAGLSQALFGINPTFGISGAILGGLTSGYKLDTTKVPELQTPCVGAGYSFGTLCPIVARGPQDAANYQTATVHDAVGSNGVNSANATIQAFERVGLVRTLAEPNLTAISGESARFLAGGEFPVPTGQDQTGKVTIEFKPFGVGLGFTPVVLSGGRISLKVSTEVSELSNQGSFSLSNGAGSAALVVPSLVVRRAETTVELPSGGAMMIAGLLQDRSKQDLDSVPGLMNAPVVGALFRSRDYLAGESELVIIITPYLVKAVSPGDLQTPADGMQVANDIDTIMLGHLNKAYHRTPPAAGTGRTYQGPFGYVVE